MLPVIALVLSIFATVVGILACVLLVNVTKQMTELTKTLGDVQKSLNGLTRTAENHQARIGKLEEKPKQLAPSSTPMGLVNQFAPGVTGSKWEPIVKLAINLVGMYFGSKIKR